MDRSKFKGGSLKTIKETRQQAEAMSGYGNRGNFHTVEEGINAFRILCAHPGYTKAYVPMRRTMLECNAEVWENGEPTGEYEVKNKTIFISTVHGSTEKDIIEVYCKYANNLVKLKVSELKGTDKEKKDREAALYFPLRGGRQNGKFKGGLQPSTTFMCYAIKDGKIGKLELYPGWMKKIEELNIDEDGTEEAEVDRFSDPDTGVTLIINKKKKEKGEGMEYILSKREFNPRKFKDWSEFIASERITDKQLSEFLEMEPLEKLYGPNVYRRKDFLMALDGLQRFDEKYKYGVFQDPDFIAELKEIDSYYPEEEEETEEKQDKKSSKTQTTKTEENEDEMSPTGENFLEYNIPQLRKYIQTYIDENYPGEKLPALKKPTLIKLAIIVENQEEIPFDELEAMDKTSTTEEKTVEKEVKSQESVTEKKETEKKDESTIQKTVEKSEGEKNITKSSESRIQKLKDLAKKGK
jgi:hypothetical protein